MGSRDYDQATFDRASEWVNENLRTDGMSDAQYQAAIRDACEHIADLDAYADLLDEGRDIAAGIA